MTTATTAHTMQFPTMRTLIVTNAAADAAAAAAAAAVLASPPASPEYYEINFT